MPNRVRFMRAFVRPVCAALLPGGLYLLKNARACQDTGDLRRSAHAAARGAVRH